MDLGWLGQRDPDQPFYLTVEGTSMAPSLQPGDQLLCSWWRPEDRPLQKGDLVLCLHPYRRRQLLIKRLAWQDRGAYYVLGDQARASTDSRAFGPLPAQQILAT